MKIQRPDVQARNGLNFSQVKKAPALQEDRFQPFVKDFENKTVETALQNAEKLQNYATRNADDAKFNRNGFAIGGTLGAGVGTCVALAGHPLIGSGMIGLSLAVAGGLSIYNHRQANQLTAEAELAGKALETMTKAADEYAATLVTDGPGPDQFTDKRYYTGGIITQIATIHSRESGAVLRTQVDLGGPVPRRLEANVAKNTVSVRSPKGDQTFNGELELGSTSFSVNAKANQSNTEGPISQTINADGSSQVYGKVNSWNGLSLTTRGASKEEGFQASTYVWENGQLASFDNQTLYVANPIVPFQDLCQVRVLPDGVVGRHTGSEETHRADEAVLPPSHGIGTWSSVSDPQLTSRLIETKFAGGFTALSDQKAGTVRITAGDGSTLDTRSTLVEANKAYRLHTQHSLGPLEQSLLPGEVLLNLQDNDRTVSVQHKSGGQPTASEHKDEEFITSGNELAVTLDEHGTYWVGEGASKIDLKPLMPLSFLEKKAAAAQ